MPCAAACDQRLLKKAFSAVPIADSHAPKLVLMIGATLLLTMYCADRSTPSVGGVGFEVTYLMVAPLATAPDHSTSRSASLSSKPPRSPGSVPFTITWGGFE